MLNIQDEIDITCPYCGETIPILIDCSAGTQEYLEDCSVCCAPIFFSIIIDHEGNPIQIVAKTDSD